MLVSDQKKAARIAAKRIRKTINSPHASTEIIGHLPMHRFVDRIVGGFWPLVGELDIRPLMQALHDQGHGLALPCTPPVGNPLIFRKWKPSHTLKAGPYDTREPFEEQPVIYPNFVLVPLLAFNAKGMRLGYGGGFYDRTLAALKARQDVFACGVAYAAQETDHIPVDEYDFPMDGIVTEQYFKVFS